jgi:anti-anti-sigma factor
MEMKIEDRLDGITMVVLQGRLDSKAAEEIDLRFSVMAGAKKSVLVDLSDVDFLASLGIRVLLTGAKAVQRKGGRLVLLVPEGNVLMVLKTAGMETLIPIYQEPNTAVAALAA